MAYQRGKKNADHDRKSDRTSGAKPGGAGNRPDGIMGVKSGNKPYARFDRKTDPKSNRKPDTRSDRKTEKARPGIAKPDEMLYEREGGGIDLIEGRNPVLEALKAERTINKILVAKGDREGSVRQITAMAREKGIVVQEVDRGKLDLMSLSRSHQGVIALAAVKDYVEVDDILKIAQDKGEPPFIVILDEIADANNLGSILRTSDAVGVHGVIIPKRRSVGLTPAVSKSSAGAVEYVPVARVTNLVQTIEYLKSMGIWIIGTDTSGEKAFFDSDLKGPAALVVGSEGEGMGRLVREKCDFIVNIPMKGSISSLNAAVAAAIVLYEIARQRGIN